MITLNVGGRITGWNSGARALFGFEAADILGCSGEALLPAGAGTGGAFVDELSCALQKGRAPVEHWCLCRDGERFWASGATTLLTGASGGWRVSSASSATTPPSMPAPSGTASCWRRWPTTRSAWWPARSPWRYRRSAIRG
ncbi:PAS domain-containing protein [Teichococcus vastitatis]|uniref:PAS domain-containing protein n=1 Tax=Teichococcus vastitatis TaxID=2307076 RepID=UPI0034631AF9